MRNYIFLSIATITGGLLAYTLLNNQNVSEQKHVATPQVEFNTSNDVQTKLNQLATSINELQEMQLAQQQKTQYEQALLKKMLIDLNSKLESTTTDSTVAAITGSIDLVDETVTVKPKELIENSLGNWMDETLSNNSWDADATTRVREQATLSLENLPNINLDDMQCSERFCRAIFSDAQNSGELPNVQKLMGNPPFTNDGFSVHGDDGRVSLYFTSVGIRFGDLQEEAILAEQLK